MWEKERCSVDLWLRRNRADSTTRKCSLHNNEEPMCVCVCVCGVPLGVAPWHTNEKNDLLQVALLLVPVTGNAHRTRIHSNPFLGWIVFVYTKISRSDGCWQLGNRGSRLEIPLHYFRHRLRNKNSKFIVFNCFLPTLFLSNRKEFMN